MWRKISDPSNPDVDEDTWWRIFGADEESLPKQLADWKKSDMYKLIQLKWARGLAMQQLSDFSAIILDWTKRMVRERQTLRETKSKTERLAPSLFDKDREGKYLDRARQLRAMTKIIDGEVVRNPAAQKKQVEEWFNDPDTTDVTAASDTSILQGYCELADDEFEYIEELVRVYDVARCYFVREVISPAFVKLVISARLEAKSAGATYQWDEVVATILGQLVNVSTHAKLFNFTHDYRAEGSSARLWIANKIKQQAQLESSGHVKLSDEIYVGYLVSQISDDEQRAFGTPSYSADLSGWNLLKIKDLIDKCKNPPRYVYQDTPLARLVRSARPLSKPETGKEKGKKNHDDRKGKAQGGTNNLDNKREAGTHQQGDGEREKRNQKKDSKKEETYQKPKHDVRPAWEKPSAFPKDMKPPTGSTVKKLYENILSGACTCCGSQDHYRMQVKKDGTLCRTCPEKQQTWERKLDRLGAKGTYWEKLHSNMTILENRMNVLPSSQTLQSYGTSSFTGGSTMTATADIFLPNDGRDSPFRAPPKKRVTEKCTLALDSHSDVTIADSRYIYGKHAIEESVNTGGGAASFTEEGFVDMDIGNGSIATVPALVATSPHQLPTGCSILLGQAQLNDLDVSMNDHMRVRGLPLVCHVTVAEDDLALGPVSQYSESPASNELKWYLGEKDLKRWFEHNKHKSVHHAVYTYKDIHLWTEDHPEFDPSKAPPLPPEVVAVLQKSNSEFGVVFEVDKGTLPKAADHPPVELNLIDGWKPVHCAEPRWGPGSGPVVQRWADEVLATGLYEPATGSSASRPHIVKKPPPGAPKDCPIEDCDLRFCGDYRSANGQIKKSVPTLPDGPSELRKIGGYDIYFLTDHYGMYNCYILAQGASRELLAVHTPRGPIQPTRMVFGEKNAGQVASNPVRTKLRDLPDNAGDRTACYVDDNAQGNFLVDSDDPLVRYGKFIKGWRDFLQLCKDNNWTLNPAKTKLGFPYATFFGFTADKEGYRLADKNLDPIRKMVPPTNLSELRHVLGVFVQSKDYIPIENKRGYAQIVKPLTKLTGSSNGQPVPFHWTPQCQEAFDKIRNYLLDGVHLSPADNRLPLHCGGDASEDGKSFGLWQFIDKETRGKDFEVIDHGPFHTKVRFLSTDTTHDIPHSNMNRRQICNFSKCWANPAQASRAPYYLEADALFWGLGLTRFWSMSSPFPLYATTDHQPLRWCKQSQKGTVSARLIEDLADIDFIVSYVPGPDNLQDSNSRYPMLGPRTLAPAGFAHALGDMLAALPAHLRRAKTVQVHAGKFTGEASKQVQQWKTTTNPVIQASISLQHPPKSPHLVIAAPAPSEASRIAIHLLRSGVPFAIFMPSDIAPTIMQPDMVKGTTITNEEWNDLGKLVYLATDKVWLIGNVEETQELRQVFHLEISTAAPLSCYSTSANAQVQDEIEIPSTLEEWKDAQQDLDLSQEYSPDQISNLDGLLILSTEDFPSLIVVPPHLREPLTRQHHAQLHHLSHAKVYTSLSRHYTWPSMRADVRKFLEDCEFCELEKAKRRKAHGMFKARPHDGPRSRYAMDYQGQGKAATGENECLAIIDTFTKWVDFYPLQERTAETLAPILLDRLHFTFGPPDILHSDEAQTFMSALLGHLHDRLGCARTTTLGHHAEGNAEVEVMWRFWNRCVRILPPSHYRAWPTFAKQIAWAHNVTPKDALGGCSPYELQFGVPPRSPFDPDPRVNPDAELPTRELANPADFASAISESAAAFHRLAKEHQQYARTATATILNQKGRPTTFSEGDRVQVYVPPTAADISRTGRPAKHITAWRGPCVVESRLSDTSYAAREEATGREFKRTIVNMRPYRPTTEAPPSHHDPTGPGPIVPGQLVAIRDAPDTKFRIAKVLSNTEEGLQVHYFGTRQDTLSRAIFKPVWTKGNHIRLALTQPRGFQPFTGLHPAHALPEVLLSTTITLTAAHKLGRKSARDLHHARDDFFFL